MAHLFSPYRKIALIGPEGLAQWCLFIVLCPFSWIYGLIGWVRGKCYDIGWLPSHKASIPVLSVGNLAAGGTGKTPVVDWLLKEFIRQGKKAVVVSRGYGGAFTGEVGIVSRGEGVLLTAQQAGDEPNLLARRNPQAAVLIARRRSDGVRFAEQQLGADLVILDDGFQHRGMQRDLDLVLLDAARPYANGWPLPAGLLREFPCALQRADLLLLTRAQSASTFSFADKPVFSSQHQLAEVALDLTGRKLQFAELKVKRLFAFAGIAEPEGFFSALSNAGLSLAGHLSLGDHCHYDAKTCREIRAAAAGCDGLITTEKDAVKLNPELFSIPCYQVPLRLTIEDKSAFWAEIQRQLWSEKCVSTRN